MGFNKRPKFLQTYYPPKKDDWWPKEHPYIPPNSLRIHTMDKKSKILYSCKSNEFTERNKKGKKNIPNGYTIENLNFFI